MKMIHVTCFLLLLLKWETDVCDCCVQRIIPRVFLLFITIILLLDFSKFILSQLVCFAWTKYVSFSVFCHHGASAMCRIKHKLPPTHLTLFSSFSSAIHNASSISDIFFIDSWNYNILQTFSRRTTPVFYLGGNHCLFSVRNSKKCSSYSNFFTSLLWMQCHKALF